MLRLMLDGHPRLICPGETDFLTDYLRASPNGRWCYDLDALAADRIFQASRAKLPKTADALPAFQAMVSNLRGDEEGCVILVAHRGLGKLLKLVPEISILHLVRDPRDVARSAIGMGWAGNTYYGARTWLKTEQEWEQVAPYLSLDQSLELRFEPLVREPEVVMGEICRFLGDQYEPEMLDYAEYSTYQRPDPALTEQWRRKQTSRELGLTEPLFRDLMIQRGYEPSGHPPIYPGSLARLNLRIEHLRSVWRRRIVRYGLWDPLFVTLYGKLGVPSLARPAQRRMDIITQQHLK